MAKIVLSVDGMSCAHCEAAIKGALADLTGVSDTLVDLSAKTVTVEYNDGQVTIGAIREAIEDQGYDVL